MRIGLKPLTAADAARCAEIEKDLFADESPWPAAGFEQEFAAAHTRYFGAWDGRELVGYAGIALMGSPTPTGAATPAGESEIRTVAVAPSYQQRGIGGHLLDLLLAKADRHGGPVFLDVRRGNDAALALYRDHGFIEVGIRPRYYQPAGADAIVMRRESAGSGDWAGGAG